MEEPKYKYSLAHVLQANYPRCNWEIMGREYTDILWNDPSPMPTKEHLDSLRGRMEKVEAVEQKKRDVLAKEVRLQESYLLLDCDQEAEAALSSIKKIHEDYRKKIMDSLFELKKIEEIKETARQEIDYFYELSQAELAHKEEAVDYLRDTDWLVIREHETGKEVPESIKIKRQAARVMVEKGEKVYKNFDSLQREELPSVEERIAAIKSGGERLKALKAQVAKTQGRFKKPRKVIDS